MSSPLGRYAAPTAAIIAIGIIGAWVVAEMLAGMGVIERVGDLHCAALVALGAVFGSAVAVNGVKQDVAATHKRLDALGAPPAADGDQP